MTLFPRVGSPSADFPLLGRQRGPGPGLAAAPVPLAAAGLVQPAQTDPLPALDEGVLLHQAGQLALLGQHGQEGADEGVVVVRAPAVVHLWKSSEDRGRDKEDRVLVCCMQSSKATQDCGTGDFKQGH